MVIRTILRHPSAGKVVLTSLILAGSACGQRTVHVRAEIPNQHGELAPVPGMRFVVLPYDRDSLLQALERQASEPRPPTDRLDSLLAEFRSPFAGFLRARAEEDRIRAALDSVRGALEGMPRSDPDYARGYDTFTALEDSLRALGPRLEAARAGLARARAEVLPAADSIRRELIAWEDKAYRSYDSLTGAIVRQLRREPVTDSTGADGRATVEVPRGEWWVYARAVNVLDPNAEWYWNVRATGDSVQLTPETGRSRPRL